MFVFFCTGHKKKSFDYGTVSENIECGDIQPTFLSNFFNILIFVLG
jgi:hypothetical protein